MEAMATHTPMVTLLTNDIRGALATNLYRQIGYMVWTCFLHKRNCASSFFDKLQLHVTVNPSFLSGFGGRIYRRLYSDRRTFDSKFKRPCHGEVSYRLGWAPHIQERGGCGGMAAFAAAGSFFLNLLFSCCFCHLDVLTLLAGLPGGARTRNSEV
jgi:hypothetical protein